MGGSGGGGSSGPFTNRTPEEFAKLVRDAEQRTAIPAFEGEVSSLLTGLLGEYNARDATLTQERLDDAKQVLKDEIGGTIDQLFGGSVAKHTYVDGLSDIDSLVMINDSDLEGKSPRVALERMTGALRRGLSDDIGVAHGQMAVTLSYPDGMQIQLLPAIRSESDRLRVPSSRRDGWSNIDPRAFRDALTRRNEECGGKLVPVIKLAKAINGTLPEAQRLSGYHMESLAIAAFRGYQGPKTPSAMLPTFFERAKDLVLAPIRDSTGQSVHVDEYLGDMNSTARQTSSHLLERLGKRMRNATAANSIGQWQALFGLDE